MVDKMNKIKFNSDMVVPNLTISGNLHVAGTSIAESTENILTKGAVTVINADNNELNVTLMGTVIRTGKQINGKYVDYAMVYDPLNESVRLGIGEYNSESNTFAFNEGEGLPIAVRDLGADDGGRLVMWDSVNYCLVKAPLQKGISENSIQQEGNTTGGKAFKFSKVDAKNKKFTLVKADGSNLSLDEVAYTTGDEYSFIFVHKYNTANGDRETYDANCKADFIGKIRSVQTEADGSVTVTVDTLHYTVKGDAVIADKYADSCLFFVPTKSTIGDIEIGQNAVTTGINNTNVGYASLIGGESNINSGMYTLMGGKFNKGGYGSLIGGRDNDGSANYVTVGGTNHKVKANRGAAFNLANEVLHENGTVVGMHNKTTAPNQLVGGKYADPSKNALFTLGNGSIDKDTKETIRSNAFEVLADGTLKTNKNNIQQYTNTAGAKGFKILGSYAEPGGKHIYTLSSTDGLKVGQRFVTVTSEADYIGGTIDYIAGTKIRTVGDTLYKLKQEPDDPSNGDIYNYLLIADRPDLGDINVGYYAVSLGNNNIAYAKAAVALGSNNRAMGKYSTALGADNIAGNLAVATGSGTKALGQASFTGGTYNEATATNAVAFGQNNINRVDNSIVGGIFNNQSDNALISIGNGTSENDRSNAFEVLKDGTAFLGGKKVATVDQLGGQTTVQIVAWGYDE